MKIRVAVLSGLNYPVPPIRGGGPQIVLYNTCLNITDPEIDWTILADWDEGLENVDFDRKKILALKTKWCDRFLLAVVNFLPYRIRKKIFSEVGNQDRLILNLKIVRKLLFRKIDVIICHESFSLAYLVHLVFPHKRIITYVHNSKLHLDFDEEMWNRYVKASTGGMILGSYSAKHDLSAKFNVLPQRVEIIYNGIDIQKFNRAQKELFRQETREKFYISQQDFVFLYCGRITPQKNIDLIVQAFLKLNQEVANTRLVIIGSASRDLYGDLAYEQLLHDLVPPGLSDRVLFTGFVPQEKLPELYSMIDCSVLGTKINIKETLPLFILESLACGTPIIASAVGAIPEVIHPAAEGYLLSPDYSLEEMISAMREMVNQRDYWSGRSKEIESYIHNNFSWQRVADDLVKIIKTQPGVDIH